VFASSRIPGIPTSAETPALDEVQGDDVEPADVHDWEVFNAGMCGGCEVCGSRAEYYVCRECGEETHDPGEPVPGECDR
jgi:hypothetical protein